VCGEEPQLRARGRLIYEPAMTRTPLALIASILIAGCGDTGLDPNDDASGVADMAAADLPAGKDLGSKSCDLVKQDCPSALPKCSIAIDQQAQAINKLCVAETGTAGEGETCARANMTVGDDDCKAGLFCSARGLPSGQLACRKFCHAHGDCLTGQKCAGLGVGKDGICTPTCDAFSGAGCPVGTTCGDPLGFEEVGSTQQDPLPIMVCRPGPGNLQPYGDCSGMGASAQCPVDTLCVGVTQTEATCFPLCDDTHACPQPPNPVDGGAPFSCLTLGSSTGSLGVCDDGTLGGP